MGVKERLAGIRSRILAAASAREDGRRAVRLVCVTKKIPVDKIKEALLAGVSDMGESRVQEAAAKRPGIFAQNPDVLWHMLGHLQTNKAAKAVAIFDLIQSVDSARLARVIDESAARLGKIQDILIEVKVSPEEAKSGCAPSEVAPLAEEISRLSNVRLCGLMAMAPYSEDPAASAPYFARAREIYDRAAGFFSENKYAPAAVLSMGMSHDFETAIAQGANMVRIGQAIFGGI